MNYIRAIDHVDATLKEGPRSSTTPTLKASDSGSGPVSARLVTSANEPSSVRVLRPY
jgi:hypothetical protein